MKLALLSFVLVTAGVAVGLRPAAAAGATMWLGLGVPYAVLVAIALWKFWDDGTLLDRLAPRWGDATKGFLVAAVLVAAAWSAKGLLAPRGSDAEAWVLRILLQLGGSAFGAPSLTTVAAICAFAAAEEIVWRGLVLADLEEKLGSRRAWIGAALLYGAAHAPTVHFLADPVAGPNPLLVFAALGAGLVWSFLASVWGRIPPLVLSHIAFDYFALAVVRM